VWQGPDLSCINLCAGDSISDVTYKLASELCAIKDLTDISTVDFDCLLTGCANTPNPEVTIAGILQLIIDDTCCSVEELTVITNNLTARTSNLYEEPILILPACLQYNDPVSGIPVTELVLSEYVLRLAQQFCELSGVVTIHTAQIANHETRITALENAPGYVPPQVTPDCTYGTVVAGVPTEMNILLENLDSQFCVLSQVLGSFTDVANVSARQCANLNSIDALSQPGTMSGLTGWNNVVSNMAQSMQNLWLTVCDMRSAIYSIRGCCDPDCSTFILGYSTAEDNTRTLITLTFNALTVIPFGFTNCPLLSTFTITDGVGNTFTDTFDLVAESTNPTGITFDITTAGLNSALPYTITVDGCITNGSNSCQKTVTSVTNAVTTTSTTTTTTVAPVSPSFFVVNDTSSGVDEGTIINATFNSSTFYTITTGSLPAGTASLADGDMTVTLSPGDNIVVNYIGPSTSGSLTIKKNGIDIDCVATTSGFDFHIFVLTTTITLGVDTFTILMDNGSC
jgi:hypothetical protein